MNCHDPNYWKMFERRCPIEVSNTHRNPLNIFPNLSNAPTEIRICALGIVNTRTNSLSCHATLIEETCTVEISPIVIICDNAL